ncbi:MAG TPA: glycosyltransferase family 9 protein [Candidatus Binataceae bacterium]|nr:glycosyltransferase family 9 protein [Candidatus Binataceae bacterium]
MSASRRPRDREADPSMRERGLPPPIAPALIARAQARIATIVGALGNAALAALRWCLWPRRRPARAERVCIFRIGNIGDTACALPAMRSIRRAWPGAHLTLVTSPGKRGMPGAQELLARARWLDEKFVYHSEDIADFAGRRRWLDAMRARKFDVWIELPAVAAKFHTLVRNMIAARLAGARWGAGWRFDGIRLFARAQSVAIDFPDEVTRLGRLLESLGIGAADEAADDAEGTLGIGERERDAVAALLAEPGARANAPLAALAPGAKAPPHQWPTGRFIEVGCELATSGYGIVLVGGSSDASLCAGIARGIGPRAMSVAGRTSLTETCELLRRCAMLICVDSGVQHLAAAAGTPCISIFSCRDLRGKWYPHGAGHTVLRKWVDCHTCLLDRCPSDNRCVKLVTVGEVIAAAARLDGIERAERLAN